MSKRSDLGNGDTCPLVAEHGNMYVLPDATPPKQYCPHVMHDGHAEVPATRKFWPVFGFEESVTAYLARVHKAVREADLPNLPNLEVL